MAKFRLNDRVRHTGTGRLGTIKQGETQVHAAASKIPYIRWDDGGYSNNHNYDITHEDMLELVEPVQVTPQFKRGDKVRLLRSDPCQVPVGAIAKLSNKLEDDVWSMYLDDKSLHFGAHTQRDKDLELVAEKDEPKKSPFDQMYDDIRQMAVNTPSRIDRAFLEQMRYMQRDTSSFMRMYMTADWGDPKAVDPQPTKPKKGTTIMSTVKEKIRKLRLSKDDLVLEEQGFLTADGERTQEFKEAVWEMLYEEYKPKVLELAKELAEAEKAEAKSKK